MNYPEWAPKFLVELHKLNTDPSNSKNDHKALDPESIIADVLQKSKEPLSEDNVENMRRQLYRRMFVFGLPEKERLALLEKLITHQNMKTVWVALSKRFKDEANGPRQFFFVCQRGITGWRGDPKQTPTERKAFYQELYDTVTKLSSLMNRADGFHNDRITELVGDESIEWLIENLEIPATYSNDTDDTISYVKFCLSDVLPSVNEVLHDISKRAIELRDVSPPMKKPNSQNAGIHYFIRSLSNYCHTTYGQPLHEVVAITTSVVFDLSNCDESYVRKIAKA